MPSWGITMGRLRHTKLACLLLGLGLCGCANDDGDRDGGGGIQGEEDDGGTDNDGDGDDGGTGDDGDDGNDGGAGDDGDDGDDGTEAPPKFDLGSVPDAGEIPDETGCQKVDLLFVIDNSGSMFDNQQNLVSSFPGFADLMMNTLEADDFNVGVVTSDSYSDNEAGCTAIGSLVTQTYAATCSPYADGNRFMTHNDDLGEKFACAGLVGDAGLADERQLQAGTLAISPALNGAGACNEGFIRNDALLVLVIITDEDDGPEFGTVGGSPGDPPDWYNTVVGIKGNIEENVVVLSLLWGMPNNVCPPPESSERVGTRIRNFTEMFTYGFIGDSCAPDYSPFFEEAISVIDDACDNFVPPG
jgi:hypothetical protein